MDADTPKAGAWIGSWRLEHPLGTGSFATTWRVTGRDGRLAALKLLREIPGDELRALKRVCHPSVVQVLDVGTPRDPYVVMELARGEALSAALEGGALPGAEAAELAAALFDALATVHAAGLRHGDVKPENLIVQRSPTCQLWLVDFGLSGQSRGGTPAWAAPEVLQGRHASPASDVYSAGLVLWTTLHGAPPYAGEDPRRALSLRCQSTPTPSVGAPWARELLEATLALDPAARPSAAEVADTLSAHGYRLPTPDAGLLRRRAASVYCRRPQADHALDHWLDRGGVLALEGFLGSGRTHALDRLEVELQARGKRVLRIAGDGVSWAECRQRFALPEELQIPPVEEGQQEGWAQLVAAELRAASPEPLHLLVDDADCLERLCCCVVKALSESGLANVCLTASAAPGWVHSRLSLEPLGRESLGELLRQLLGTDDALTAPLEETLSYSGGRPGSAVAFILAAVRSGALSRRASRWIWDESRRLALESALDHSDTLPATSPAATEAGGLLALWRHSLPVSALAFLLGRGDLQGVIHELVALGFARLDGEHLRLTDRQHAQVLEERLGDPRAAHARLVDWLKLQLPPPLAQLGWHAAKAGDARLAAALGPRAVTAALREDPLEAAQLADALWELAPAPALVVPRMRALVASGQVEEGSAFGERHLGDPPDVEVLIELASIQLNHQAHLQEALQYLYAARDLLGDAPPPQRLLLMEAQAWSTSGDYERCAESAGAVASAPPPIDPEPLDRWLQARYLWAQALHRLERLPEALEVLEAVPAEVGRGTASRATLTAALGRLLWFAGRFKDAERALTRAARADSGLSLLDRARLTNNLGAVRYNSGDRAGALKAWESALLLFERLQARIEVIRAQVNLCLGYKEMGRWERARQAGLAALEGAREMGSPDLECMAATNLGELALAQAQLDEAGERLTLAAGIAAENELSRDRVEIQRLLTELALREGREDAAALAEEARALAAAEGLVAEGCLAAALLAVCVASRAAPSALDALIEAAMKPLQELGDATALASARLWVAQALMAAGRAPEAAVELERAQLYAAEVSNVPLLHRAEVLEGRLARQWQSTEGVDQLQKLTELAVAISEVRALPELLQQIAQGTLELLGVDRSFVLMGAPLTVVSEARREGSPPGSPSMSVVEQAMEEQREVLAFDLGERGDLRQRESILAMNLCSLLCVPMLHHGEVLGVIYVDSLTTSQKELRETAQLLRALASLAAVAIIKVRYFEQALQQARKAAVLTERQRSARELAGLARQLSEKNAELERLNEELQRAVSTDPLTGISNRRHLMEILSEFHAQRAGEGARYGLLMIDIDHFKRFNDRFGHKVGDAALVRVAQTLRGALRGDDMVFRYGGEELVVLARSITEESILQLGERLRRAVSSQRVDGARGESLSISLGAAVYSGEAPESWEALLQRADDALYRAKHLGRNRCILWDEDEFQLTLVS